MTEANHPEAKQPGSERRIEPLSEIFAVFGIALLILALGRPLAGDDPLAFQGVVWVANIATLATIWWTLRRRGRGWSDLGLASPTISGRGAWRLLWKSLVVFVAAMIAFGIGSVVMVNIVGRPEPADMSGYQYLSGNLPMLLVALAGVFVASSLGEEIVYRGFLITRIEALGGGGRNALRAAILAGAVIFGLVHYSWGPMGMVQTGFMGLALAISFIALGRDLWPLVVAHFYMDAILLVQMYLMPAS